MSKAGKSAVTTVSAMIIITLTGKVTGLIREIMTGAAFGSEGAGAAFNMASIIPRNFLDVAFASAISGCFIPVFNERLQRKGKTEAFTIANLFLTAVLIFSIAVTIVCVIFSNNIARLMGPGNTRQTQELTSALFKITWPIVILSSAAFSLVGVLQSMGEFNIPAAMSIVSNGCIIIYCIFFAETLGVYGLAAAFLLGWGMQIIIQIPALKRIGYVFKPKIDFKNRAWREIGALILPVMISAWVSPLNDMVNISVTTRVSESASVAYSKANVLYSVITGVFVLSVANYIFPQLSRISAANDEKRFADVLRAVLRLALYILIPMSVGLYILSAPLCRIVFLSGKFDAAAVTLTSTALSYFCVGMVGFGFQTILSRAFYAQRNAVIPLLTGILAVVVNFGLSFVLKDYMDVGGPALSVSVSLCLTAAVMFIFTYKTNKYILNKGMFKDFLLVCLSAAVMGLIIVLIGAYIKHDLMRVCISAVIGVIIYLALTYIFRIKEARAVIDIIRRLKVAGAEKTVDGE